MEIKGISNALKVYNKVKMNAVKTGGIKAEKKTDKVEFNFARSVEAAKANLASEINAGASQSKIDSLKDAVANGSYDVSPESVVDAMMMF